jgi:chromatin segregation and condensation protein Rec8/ScpA/Scc1 (kleisin family)
MDLPTVPAPMHDFLPFLARQPKVNEAIQPFKTRERKLREIFARDPNNAILNDSHINTVPIFAGHEHIVKIRARDLDHETSEEKEKYLLPLSASDRKPNGSPAIVGSLEEFRTNFTLFSESSLANLNWNNIVAAGSSVVTSLLPVEAPHIESKRTLRQEISPHIIELR